MKFHYPKYKLVAILLPSIIIWIFAIVFLLVHGPNTRAILAVDSWRYIPALLIIYEATSVLYRVMVMVKNKSVKVNFSQLEKIYILPNSYWDWKIRIGLGFLSWAGARILLNFISHKLWQTALY